MHIQRLSTCRGQYGKDFQRESANCVIIPFNVLLGPVVPEHSDCHGA